MERIARRIRVAAGEAPADVLLVNGRVVDVFTGRIEEASVALCDGRIAGVGDYAEGAEVHDCRGLHVVPSFIDAHIHVESTMLDVPAFASRTGHSWMRRSNLSCRTRSRSRATRDSSASMS